MRRIAGKKTNGLDLNPRRSFQEDMLSWFHLSKNLLLNISNDPDATEFYLDPKKGKIKEKILDTIQDLKFKIGFIKQILFFSILSARLTIWVL